MPRLVLVVLCCAVLSVAGRAQVHRMAVGDEARWSLTAEAPARVEVELGAEGVVTVVALSAFGVPTLTAADPDSADVGPWVEGARRCILRGEPGGLASLVVAVPAARGDVWVDVRAGSQPAPGPLVGWSDTARWSELRAGLFEAVGDTDMAWSNWFNAGNAWHLAGELGRAGAALARSRRLPAPPGMELQVAVGGAMLGGIHVEMGRLAEAEPLLVAAEEQLGQLGHEPGRLLAVCGLIDLELAHGRVDAATAWLDQGAQLAESTGDLGHQLQIVRRRVEVDVTAGELGRALVVLEEALALARRQGVDEAVHELHLSLGTVLRRRGELDAAVEILSRVGGPTTSAEQRLRASGELLLTDYARSDLQRARRRAGEALDDARQLAHPRFEVMLLLQLALVHTELRDDDAATRTLQHAHERLTELADPRLVAQWEETRLAVLVRLRGQRPVAPDATPDAARTTRRGSRDPEAVEPSVESALDAALLAARAVGDRRMEGRLFSHAATHAFECGQPERAVVASERQLALARDVQDRPSEAQALGNLAHAHLALGEAATALGFSREAVTLCRGYGDWRSLLAVLVVQAEAALGADRIDDAEAALDEVGQLLVAPQLARLDPEEASRWRSHRSHAHAGELWQDLVVRRVAAAQDRARTDWIRRGFVRAGAWKARGLLEGIVEHRGGRQDADLIVTRRERARLLADRDELQRRRSRAGRQGTADDAATDAALDTLERRLAEVESSLWARDPERRPLVQPERLEARALLDPVPRDALLVDFVAGTRNLYAYVWIDGHLALHDLGARAALRGDVERFVAGISRPGQLDDVTEVARRGRDLYERLVAPWAAGVDRGRPLLVVPNSDLATLPFQALVVEAPAAPTRFAELRFLVQDRTVAHAPSTPVLGVLADRADRGGQGRVLLLADPTYADEDELARLPGTRDEVLAILAATDAAGPPEPDRRDLRWSTGRYDLLTGREASRAVFLQDLSSYAVLHLAAHGVVDGDARFSGLSLSSAEGRADHLALAEVLELDLDADLVVLSACDTARGTLRRGEGVQSLGRAFLHAGARRVVASLWQVSDRATARLMEALHRHHLVAGVAPAEALRRAQLELLTAAAEEAGDAARRGRPLATPRPASRPQRDAGHPYTWAAFLHTGWPR